MAYKIIAKNDDAYAIQDTSTGEIEALTGKYIEIALNYGLEIDGASLNENGSVVFSDSIQDFVIEDDEEEYDEEDYEEEEYEEEEEEDAYEYDIDADCEDEEEYEEEEDEEEYEIEDDDYDYEEDEYTKESSVGKLYSYLSEEQIKILKRYYLWFSQRIFSTAQKDPTLGMKDMRRLQAKQKDLASLRNLGGMWHYAGFIDTGYDGGGYCTLGHKLRYMHLAWDVSVSDIESAFFGDEYTAEFEDVIQSNNCIVFGLKCVSDFFEVDSDCTKALQRAQRESLKDMNEMYLQYEGGTVNEVIGSFTLMDNLMSKIKKQDAKGLLFGDNYEFVLPPSLTSFYFQFRESNMPVPRSLIYEIRNKLVGWGDRPFYGSIGIPSLDFNTKMRKIYGKKYDKFFERYYKELRASYLYQGYNDLVQYFLMSWFIYEICGYFKYNGDQNSFEGGRSVSVRSTFASIYTSLNRAFWNCYDYTDEFFDKLVVFDSLYKSLDVIDTREVIHQYDSDGEDIIPYDKLVEYRDTIRSMSNRPCRKTYSERYTIDEGISVLKEALDNYQPNLDKYKALMERKAKEKEEQLAREREREEQLAREREEQLAKEVKETPDTTEESSLDTDSESEVTVSESDVNKFLSTYDLSTITDGKLSFGKTLAEKTVAVGKEPSVRQQYYLNKLYTSLTGNTVQKPTNSSGAIKYNIEDNQDYKKAVDYACSNGGTDFYIKVCKSVKRYGTYTEKQKKYLDLALEEYKKDKGII